MIARFVKRVVLEVSNIELLTLGLDRCQDHVPADVTWDV